MQRGPGPYLVMLDEQEPVKYLDPDMPAIKIRYYGIAASEIAINPQASPADKAELLEWWSFAVTRDEQIAAYHSKPVKNGKLFLDAVYENWAALNGDMTLADVDSYISKAGEMIDDVKAL